MLKHILRALSACACISPWAHAMASGFVEGSHADLTLRNYYFDRNYVNATPQAAAREWAQGFLLNVRSGYTEGPIGFGLDAQGQLGVRLDSSKAHTGTGLLPYSASTREPADAYSELGLTAKARASHTELQVGTISTVLPIAFASPTRLLPQTFRGAYVTSRELQPLTLHLGWLDRINLRDATHYQKMSVGAPNGRFNGSAESDRFTFIGGDYAWSEQLTLKYYHAELAELYRKDYLGFVDHRPLGPGTLKSDFRLFITGEDGAGKAGPVDNRNTALMLTYALGSHAFGAGYMQLTGTTGMPYLFGTEPLVITEGTLSSEFLNPRERSWQVRYDYNFAGLGAPGLKAMVRYVQGDNIELPTLGGSNLSESEKDLEISYILQSGPLKDLSLRVRHAWYRNDFAAQASHRDDNELRINIDYTWKLW